jgi:hypothetical protein
MLGLSPYRCVSCGDRFWIISTRIRKQLLSLVVVVALIATITVVFKGLSDMGTQPSQPRQSGRK